METKFSLVVIVLGIILELCTCQNRLRIKDSDFRISKDSPVNTKIPLPPEMNNNCQLWLHIEIANPPLSTEDSSTINIKTGKVTFIVDHPNLPNGQANFTITINEKENDLKRKSQTICFSNCENISSNPCSLYVTTDIPMTKNVHLVPERGHHESCQENTPSTIDEIWLLRIIGSIIFLVCSLLSCVLNCFYTPEHSDPSSNEYEMKPLKSEENGGIQEEVRETLNEGALNKLKKMTLEKQSLILKISIALFILASLCFVVLLILMLIYIPATVSIIMFTIGVVLWSSCLYEGFIIQYKNENNLSFCISKAKGNCGIIKNVKDSQQEQQVTNTVKSAGKNSLSKTYVKNGDNLPRLEPWSEPAEKADICPQMIESDSAYDGGEDGEEEGAEGMEETDDKGEEKMGSEKDEGDCEMEKVDKEDIYWW